MFVFFDFLETKSGSALVPTRLYATVCAMQLFLGTFLLASTLLIQCRSLIRQLRGQMKF
jgi:hypothetical protein